jgi:hypothetical protein
MLEKLVICMQKTETRPLSLTLGKSQFKMDQRFSCKTWNSETTVGITCEFIDIGNNFLLNRTPIAQEIRTRIDKWDFIKLKSFCTLNKTISRIKR